MSDSQTQPLSINTGYGHLQLARALQTSTTHADPSIRASATAKIARWMQVLNGMATGTLTVGSRTPIANVPAWATPEVVTGGFVTGALLAGGPLQEHELALLAELQMPQGGRVELNTFYLSEIGLARLQAMLQTGQYELTVAEEGALLCVAWLLHNDRTDEAHTLLESIAPFFGQLRFYPVPAQRAARQGTQLHLQNVGEAVQRLAAVQPSHAIQAQRESITVWQPLYAKMVQLFLDTVEGDVPQLASTEPPVDGEPRSVVGGMPCRQFFASWFEEAQALLVDYETAAKQHTLCKPAKKRHMHQLHVLLTNAARGQTLSPKQVEQVRFLLACYITKHGVPQSDRWQNAHALQLRQIAIANFADLAATLRDRLKPLPADGGLEQPQLFLKPIGDLAVPTKLAHIVERCLDATIPVLVELGLLTSGEALARVLPILSAQLRASGLADPSLRNLYAAIYRAFRRRRSLLLLNLESQVRVEELPWLQAIEQRRQKEMRDTDLARQALHEVVVLTLTAFPHAIIPNKLLQEVRALLKSADIKLPLVDEIASDIFMGEFGPQFLEAAQIAGSLLRDSLYARYYEIDYVALAALPIDNIKPRWGTTRTGTRFAALCYQRAGMNAGGRSVAYNGTVIEQEQILTTHNLAVLVSGLQLQGSLTPHWFTMAQTCFVWVCERQQLKYDSFHARLIMLKNTAYAWRQMVFYVAMLNNAKQAEWFTWMEAHFASQDEVFRARFAPAIVGLTSVARNEPRVGRVLLGWSAGRHWLLAETNES